MAKRTTLKNWEEELEERITFDEAKATFLQSCRARNLSKPTLNSYNYALDYFVERSGAIYLDEFNIEAIEKIITDKLDEGTKPTTINHFLRSWRAFAKFTANRFEIKEVNVRLVKEEKVVKPTYSEQELELLLQKPKRNDWVEFRSWAMVNYFVGTGNRLSTLLALKIKDIKFEDGLIFLSTVKDKNQKYIPLSPALAKALQLYLKTFDWVEDDYLFQTNEGGQLSVRTAEQQIKRYAEKRGVKDAGCHKFRHTFAKLSVLNGINAFELQAMLGHSTLDMTKHYCNIYGTELQKNFSKYSPLDKLA